MRCWRRGLGISRWVEENWRGETAETKGVGVYISREVELACEIVVGVTVGGVVAWTGIRISTEITTEIANEIANEIATEIATEIAASRQLASKPKHLECALLLKRSRERCRRHRTERRLVRA